MHETYWESAAHLLGMKRSEIVDLHQVDHGTVVTTHDGQRTLVAPEGVVGPWAGELPAIAAPDRSITCPKCGRTSHSPDDVANRYCGACHQFHDQMAADSEPVPDGTAAEVLAWVGDDPERARRALDAERARRQPRAGLGAQLEKIAYPEKLAQ